MNLGVIAQRFGLPLRESIDASAAAGVDGVQLYAASPRERLVDFSAAERREVREYCAGAGLEIFSICGEVGGFGFREADKNPAKIEYTKRNIDLALELGCHIVTSHIGVVQTSPDSPLRQAQLAALAEIGRYAAACGAYLAIETGPEDAVTLNDFLDELDSPGIGVNLDPGNLVMITGTDPAAAVRTFGGRIVHSHIKDGVRYRPCEPERVYRAFATGGIKQLIAESGRLFAETPVGEGAVNWPEYVQAMAETGFRGAWVIEREAANTSVKEISGIINRIRKLQGEKYAQLQ